MSQLKKMYSLRCPHLGVPLYFDSHCSSSDFPGRGDRCWGPCHLSLAVMGETRACQRQRTQLHSGVLPYRASLSDSHCDRWQWKLHHSCVGIASSCKLHMLCDSNKSCWQRTSQLQLWIPNSRSRYVCNAITIGQGTCHMFLWGEETWPQGQHEHSYFAAFQFIFPICHS